MRKKRRQSFTPPTSKKYRHISPQKLNQVILGYVKGTLTKADIVEEIALEDEPVEKGEVVVESEIEGDEDLSGESGESVYHSEPGPSTSQAWKGPGNESGKQKNKIQKKDKIKKFKNPN